jgi:hypothetical protein
MAELAEVFLHAFPLPPLDERRIEPWWVWRVWRVFPEFPSMREKGFFMLLPAIPATPFLEVTESTRVKPWWVGSKGYGGCGRLTVVNCGIFRQI